MIAAVAGMSCRSTAELLALGPPLVCLNLRLMFAAMDRSHAIDPDEGLWTTMTPGMTSDQHKRLIENFRHQNVRPQYHKLTVLECERESDPPRWACVRIGSLTSVQNPIQPLLSADLQRLS
jgi:hypothetical protein